MLLIKKIGEKNIFVDLYKIFIFFVLATTKVNVHIIHSITGVN